MQIFFNFFNYPQPKNVLIAPFRALFSHLTRCCVECYIFAFARLAIADAKTKSFNSRLSL